MRRTPMRTSPYDGEQAVAGAPSMRHSEFLPMVKRFYPYESEKHLAEITTKLDRVCLESTDVDRDAEAYLQRRTKAESLARRVYGGDERSIAQHADQLVQVSNEEFSFYEICCPACREFGSTEVIRREEYHREKHFRIPRREIKISNLREDCGFCNILRKCQQRFAPRCRLIKICFQGDKSDKQLCFRESVEKDKCRDIHVQLYSSEPIAAIRPGPFPYMREFDQDAGSQASLDVMKQWIDHCQKTHDHAPTGHYRGPSRLIKLSKSEQHKAQICSPRVPVKFAALSYRWGADANSATKRYNVKERYKKLVTSDFPQTLQDAIRVTRGLGLEYLWIDRICIVQDDDDDWAREASIMADIYETAYVVVSATATEDCRDGFLRKSSKPPLVLKYTQPGQGTFEVRARQIEGHNCDWKAPNIHYALDSRGWCFQERYLARRAIHFLPTEIVFQCEIGRQCECGAAGKEDFDYSEDDGLGTFLDLRDEPNLDPKKFHFGADWMLIASEYSKMNLTYGGDSLPALSGLAASLAHLKAGEFIAGLWQKDIVFQLAWHIEPGLDYRRWTFPENVDVLGPTFSWSSHVRPVVKGREDAKRNICTLKSFEVDLATSNPYGKVRHASIRLNGPMVSGRDLIAWYKTSDDKQDTADVYLDSGLCLMVPFLYRDATSAAQYTKLERGIDWDSVICFGLYECGTWAAMQLDVLLLQPSKTRKGDYVRIGLVSGLWKPWFYDRAVERTITVV